MGAKAILRLALGLVIGFAGAFVTLQTIDRFSSGPEGPVPVAVMLGEPDIAGYCARDESARLEAFALTEDAYGWQCAGFVGRLWTATGLNMGEVCRWQFGDAAYERLIDADSPTGWRCVSDP